MSSESNPKVSVVIACYNASRYIRQAIDSALTQDYRPLEVVLVDDGSTDDSAQIISSYGQRVTLISQANVGVSAARNRGVEAASGEVIVLLDADDKLLPGCISKRIEALREHDCTLVTGPAEYIDAENMRLQGEYDRVPTGLLRYEMVMRHFPGPPSGWTFAKETLLRSGSFDVGLRSAEDHDLCLRLATLGYVYRDREAMVQYRVLPNSLSRDYVSNYEQVQELLLKQRAVTPLSPFRFWWSSRVMLFNAAVGVFTNGAAGKLYRRHPGVVVFWFAWIMRAVWNRLLLLFRTGPLWEKGLNKA